MGIHIDSVVVIVLFATFAFIAALALVETFLYWALGVKNGSLMSHILNGLFGATIIAWLLWLGVLHAPTPLFHLW